MSDIETSGYKKWWPMKKFDGYNPDGSKKSCEVFRNMKTGEVCNSYDTDGNDLGWNGEPPPLETGEKNLVDAGVSNAYACGYDKIRWDKK